MSMGVPVDFDFGCRKNGVPSRFQDKWSKQNLIWRQVHGVCAHEVHSTTQNLGECDTLWSRTPKLCVAVRTADCVPILLWRNDGQAVAAVHSGWRGTYAHAVLEFFKQLPPELSGAQPGNLWHAAIGPAIGACCYEVSTELAADFTQRFGAQHLTGQASRHLDLVGVITQDLNSIGISVAHHSECTYCTQESDGTPRYESYRREPTHTARQLSVIQLK